MMVETGLTPLEGQAVNIRQMTRAIEDIKAAYDSLDAKILNILGALQDAFC